MVTPTPPWTGQLGPPVMASVTVTPEIALAFGFLTVMVPETAKAESVGSLLVAVTV